MYKTIATNYANKGQLTKITKLQNKGSTISTKACRRYPMLNFLFKCFYGG